jgi:hypothetical protein
LFYRDFRHVFCRRYTFSLHVARENPRQCWQRRGLYLPCVLWKARGWPLAAVCFRVRLRGGVISLFCAQRDTMGTPWAHHVPTMDGHTMCRPCAYHVPTMGTPWAHHVPTMCRHSGRICKTWPHVIGNSWVPIKKFHALFRVHCLQSMPDRVYTSISYTVSPINNTEAKHMKYRVTLATSKARHPRGRTFATLTEARLYQWRMERHTGNTYLIGGI